MANRPLNLIPPDYRSAATGLMSASYQSHHRRNPLSPVPSGAIGLVDSEGAQYAGTNRAPSVLWEDGDSEGKPSRLAVNAFTAGDNPSQHEKQITNF